MDNRKGELSKKDESMVKWKVIIVEVSFRSNGNRIMEELVDPGSLGASAVPENLAVHPEGSEERMKMPQKK